MPLNLKNWGYSYKSVLYGIDSSSLFPPPPPSPSPMEGTCNGGTRNFLWGIEGAKCISERAKNPKICQKWLIWTIFFLLIGGKWGKSLRLGGKCSHSHPPPPPPDAATGHMLCNESYSVVKILYNVHCTFFIKVFGCFKIFTLKANKIFKIYNIDEKLTRWKFWLCKLCYIFKHFIQLFTTFKQCYI